MQSNSNTKPEPRVKTPAQTEPLEVRRAIKSRATITAIAALKKIVFNHVDLARAVPCAVHQSSAAQKNAMPAIKKKAKKTPVNSVRTGGILTVDDGSARIPLKPRENQKSFLDSLFSGPAFVLELLKKPHQPITSKETAALFLLAHHKELQPFLCSGDRTEAVDWLKELLQQWSKSGPDEIRLLLPQDCSISREHEIYLPINGLGTLPPLDSEAVSRLRSRRRYVQDFVLVHQNGHYSVDIRFCQPHIRTEQLDDGRQSRKESPSQKQLRKPPNRHQNNQTTEIPISRFLAMFTSTLNARLLNDLRISQQFSRANFDRLEGWGVSGGLPSLGKRS